MRTTHPSRSTEWTGILRLAFPTLTYILVFSIITLGIAGSWGRDVAHDKKNDLSIAALVFYLGTIPLLSILATTFLLVLQLTSRLTFTLALVISTVFCTAWIVQTSIWLDCELIGPGVRESVDDYCPSAGPDGTGVGKMALAWAVLAGYLMHIGLAAYGVAQVRKGGRLGDGVGENGEGGKLGGGEGA